MRLLVVVTIVFALTITITSVVNVVSGARLTVYRGTSCDSRSTKFVDSFIAPGCTNIGGDSYQLECGASSFELNKYTMNNCPKDKSTDWFNYNTRSTPDPNTCMDVFLEENIRIQLDCNEATKTTTTNIIIGCVMAITAALTAANVVA